MNLAVVTSCHNYGRFLAEWAASILAQTTRPAMAVIVDNGSTDDTPERIREAVATLEQGGLRALTVRIERCNFGRARNAAVALADTEWVMHLDADDVLLPHALADAAALEERADVIAFGYQRFGDLDAGPPNPDRLYPDSQGVETLRSVAPASGVSPFRKSLWARRPYHEDLEGAWDTALWIGFAHLGARFVGTGRPCFLYRQHADSIFNRRRKDRDADAITGAKLNALRWGTGGVSVLVPWQADGGPRDASWEWVQQRYAALYPDWQVVTGTCEGDWRKGVAVNAAAAQATGDVFIIADADCVLPPDALREAVVLARDGKWVVPHTAVRRLDRESTGRILASPPDTPAWSGRLKLIRDEYTGFAGGGFVVLPRRAFEEIRGFPTAFTGWGAEDETLAIILDTLVGQHVRLAHPLWHLWHEPGPRTSDPAFPTNAALLRAYRAANGNREAMKELVEQQEGPRPADSVRMVAVRSHMGDGNHMIARGTIFVATEEKARWYETRVVNPLATRLPLPTPPAAPAAATEPAPEPETTGATVDEAEGEGQVPPADAQEKADGSPPPPPAEAEGKAKAKAKKGTKAGV